jgi:hypothetical protein
MRWSGPGNSVARPSGAKRHRGRPLNSIVSHQSMTVTLGRIVVISVVSAIAPIVFFVGWAANIPGLYSWPTWLIWLWPSSIMFIPGGGASPTVGAFLIFPVSLVINAVIWCLVLFSALWLLTELPMRTLRAKEKIDG